MLDKILPDKVPTMFRRLGFWLLIAYIVLAAVAVRGQVTQAQTTRNAAHTAKEQAIRRSSQESAIVSDYKVCVRSAPSIARVNKFLHGVNDLADILIQNAAAGLKAAPPGDPLNPVRRASLIRLRKARANVAVIKRFPVPTKAECVQRRRKAMAALPDG
jgi:hypothetical protein